MSSIPEAVLQFQEVFHDAVMHHGYLPATLGQGMSVGVGGWAVSGPAGMPQANRAFGETGLGTVGQTFNLADRFAEMQPAWPIVLEGLQHRNAGAIVAPVFQPLQAFQNDGPGRLAAHISYNTAHIASGENRREITGRPRVRLQMSIPTATELNRRWPIPVPRRGWDG